MLEPFDCQSRSFRLVAVCLAQELDKPLALFGRLLLVTFLSDLRAIFIAWHGADIDVVPHRSPLSEKL